jgi:hypothetical protein
VFKPGSDKSISESKSEVSRGVDDGTSAASDRDNDGSALGAVPESTVSVGYWNIHGLASYKQKLLLYYSMQARLDVLALCETHLTNQEQLVQWEQAVAVPDSLYCWFGRPAVRAGSQDRGRGSGGVGLLIRRDWFDFCTELPACEHDQCRGHAI